MRGEDATPATQQHGSNGFRPIGVFSFRSGLQFLLFTPMPKTFGLFIKGNGPLEVPLFPIRIRQSWIEVNVVRIDLKRTFSSADRILNAIGREVYPDRKTTHYRRERIELFCFLDFFYSDLQLTLRS